eukprot:TRINITY_DN65086_c0_g1_i1.p1 TRINITY_DN65086_c0_g1~~TRINITY_DN65086_c0_g1_i1.p1  ORF type:complete len:123 (+),score=11.63 TRINITY_DN65086_c0_g1_i1:68-436(+)
MALAEGVDGPNEADAIMEEIQDDIEAPEGFDEKSTVVVANLPYSTSPLHVGAFFSWFAPVVHVEKLKLSVRDTDSNYAITFVDHPSAERVLGACIRSFVDDDQCVTPICVGRLPERTRSWWG